MTPFQIIGIFVLALGLAASLTLAIRRRGPLHSLAALGWLVGLVLMIDPELSNWASRRMGIQRGVDLVLYSYVLASAFAISLLYLKSKRLERDLTVLVRRVALDTAREPGERPKAHGEPREPDPSRSA